ncbi:hypothetical protein M422DRAFT_69398 [Sphaerobolus stellatus SS14]|uniref:Uncharacterized protein n=1 Tax=Sphaerobolus stellatus (strain SS14) TaxID=990650 RepID=A0A0C9U319_SPHS4|nr:hypothetical protein M422DRAFT_69398 [Sphaerobolus stellatus SS14]
MVMIYGAVVLRVDPSLTVSVPHSWDPLIQLPSPPESPNPHISPQPQPQPSQNHRKRRSPSSSATSPEEPPEDTQRERPHKRQKVSGATSTASKAIKPTAKRRRHSSSSSSSKSFSSSSIGSGSSSSASSSSTPQVGVAPSDLSDVDDRNNSGILYQSAEIVTTPLAERLALSPSPPPLNIPSPTGSFSILHDEDQSLPDLSNSDFDFARDIERFCTFKLPELSESVGYNPYGFGEDNESRNATIQINDAPYAQHMDGVANQ